MIVYVVMGCMQYECATLESVHASKEGADAAAQAIQDDRERRYDAVRVVDVEVLP